MLTWIESALIIFKTFRTPLWDRDAIIVAFVNLEVVISMVSYTYIAMNLVLTN